MSRFLTMKSFVRVFAALANCIAVFGCATQYSSQGFAGGYSDTQLAPDAFRIAFSGNGFTSAERAQDFAILRAADLTLGHGFRYFAIVSSASGATQSSVNLPGQSYTTVQATGYGNSVYGTAATTYMPPTSIPIFKPNSSMFIRCFAEKPPDGYVFDAQFLSRSLRSKYGIKH
jgi:hypothetical protein